MASNQDPGLAEEEEEDDDEEEISEDSIKNNVNTFRDYLEKAIVVKDLVGHFELFARGIIFVRPSQGFWGTEE